MRKEHKVFKFYYTINDNDVVMDLLDGMNIKQSKNNIQYMKTILANCYVYRYPIGRFQMAIGKNNQTLKRKSRYNPLMIMPYSLINIIKTMERHGFLSIDVGYCVPNGSRVNASKSTIKVTKKLLPYLDMIPKVILANEFEYVQLVVDGNRVEYEKDSVEYATVRQFMVEYNNFIRKYEIKHPSSNALNVHPKYAYVTYQDIEGKLGGRVYGNWQMLSKEDRGRITINGKRVVELDFRAMNVAMVYALKNEELVEDPYILNCGLPREYAKALFLVIFGSKTRMGAVCAADYKIRDDNKADDKNLSSEEIQLKYANLKKDLIKAYDEIVETHEIIGQYFLGGPEQPLKFQNIDSRVCVEILKSLMGNKIVCLSVHDSFIVQERHEDDLREAMIEAFKKYLNDIEPVIK